VEHTVERSWETILGWFEEFSRAERPSFRGPAAEEDLRAVEQATGRPLPVDQLAWWRLSDGTEEDGPLPSLIPVVWAPASVAYALHRHRSHLFLDLREGPQHGCVGRMDREDISFGEPVWLSVTDMLAEVAAALVNGTDIGGRHAVVEDGRLNWLLDPQRHSTEH
jgi:cell wall assembly regulator SMI1